MTAPTETDDVSPNGDVGSLSLSSPLISPIDINADVRFVAAADGTFVDDDDNVVEEEEEGGMSCVDDDTETVRRGDCSREAGADGEGVDDDVETTVTGEEGI